MIGLRLALHSGAVATGQTFLQGCWGRGLAEVKPTLVSWAHWASLMLISRQSRSQLGVTPLSLKLWLFPAAVSGLESVDGVGLMEPLRHWYLNALLLHQVLTVRHYPPS